MRTCFISDSIVGAVTASVSVFQFATYLREGVTMPLRMVKLWKSLARGEQNRIPLSWFSFASPDTKVCRRVKAHDVCQCHLSVSDV